MVHYHIHWLGGGSDKLDWEAFSTKIEAERAASQLVRPDERFAIDQFDGDCPLCKTQLQVSTGPNSHSFE